MKVLVADKLSKVGVDWLASQDDVEVTVKPGLPPEELAKIVGEYDGMIVRSGAKVTAEVLAEPGNLKCVARAGVGVDNIDVPVATAKGVIVMNTPGGNTLSTAELTLALMMVLSRKIAPANASLREGKWDRKKYQGTQLAGKTLGVIGMGRIGRAVAKRANALEMRVLGFDPFFAGQCPEGAFEMVKDLDELCRRADYITLHTPKSPDTIGMIGPEQFALMKPSARLVNAARGGIIDEAALLDAVKNEKIAGVALDVYTSEPPASDVLKELIAHPNVLAVPHLGASTEEAQDQVALEAAQQLVQAVRGEEVRNALNAPGFDQSLSPVMQAYAELARRMGIILSTITPGALQKVEVIYRGAIADMNVKPLTTFLLVGLLQVHMDEPINIVNAPVLAEQRGVEVDQITSGKVREFANLMEVEIHTDKMKRSAVGTIFGNKFPRIMAIDGYHIELKPEGPVVVIFNVDRPGVVGRYGTIFGNNNINIADMTFSRKLKSGLAVVGINLDQAPSEAVMGEIRAAELVEAAYFLDLPALPLEDEEE